MSFFHQGRVPDSPPLWDHCSFHIYDLQLARFVMLGLFLADFEINEVGFNAHLFGFDVFMALLHQVPNHLYHCS